MLAVTASQFVAGLLVVLGCAGAFLLLRLTNRQQAEWARLRKILSQSNPEEWHEPARSLEDARERIEWIAKGAVPFLLILYLAWIFTSPPSNDAVSAEESAIPEIAQLDATNANASGTTETNIHQFYRDKLTNVGQIQTDLIQKLASAQVNRSNLINRASQVESERNQLLSDLEASAQTETVLKDQLAAADELQAQLVAELSKAQTYITALSDELATARFLQSQLMEDLNAIVEKLGPNPQSTDIEEYSVTGNVRHELYLARQRLKEVAIEILDARNRFNAFNAPIPVEEPVEVERIQMTNPQ